MAVFNVKFTGVVAGAGAGAAPLGTIPLPSLGSTLKGATKVIVRNSLPAYQGCKMAMERTTKAIEHIASEARSELKQNNL